LTLAMEQELRLTIIIAAIIMKADCHLCSTIFSPLSLSPSVKNNWSVDSSQ
jgi:hypothetical protein